MRARVRRLSLRNVLAISISQIINLEVIWAGQQWIGAQTLAMTLVFDLGISALDEEDEKMNAADYAEGTDFTKKPQKRNSGEY